MRLPDSFSFRRRPRGLFKRILGLPVLLYRYRLGFLLGDRFLLITHVGRRTGELHHTPVEVVVHDADTREYIVCSGTGPRADWYRNLQAKPVRRVQVGNRRWVPDQRMLDDDEAAARFAEYELAHPRAAEKLLESMGNSYDGTAAGRVVMMADMPMVAFSEDGPPAVSDL